MDTVLYIVGIIGFILACAALQRKYFPHTLVNGYMDMDKLENICPGIFKNMFGNKKKENGEKK